MNCNFCNRSCNTHLQCDWHHPVMVCYFVAAISFSWKDLEDKYEAINNHSTHLFYIIKNDRGVLRLPYHSNLTPENVRDKVKLYLAFS